MTSHGSDKKQAGLIQLISSLNDSVKNLASRFDGFQQNIENKVHRMEGEMVLLKNKMNMLESQLQSNKMAQLGVGLSQKQVNNYDFDPSVSEREGYN